MTIKTEKDREGRSQKPNLPWHRVNNAEPIAGEITGDLAVRYGTLPLTLLAELTAFWVGRDWNPGHMLYIYRTALTCACTDWLSVMCVCVCAEGPGIYDVCEKEQTGATDYLTPQQREDITASAQVGCYHHHNCSNYHWQPSPSIDLAVLCFYSKIGFWPSYCQISTDLDKILHTHTKYTCEPT